jgi:hypothetical protein
MLESCGDLEGMVPELPPVEALRRLPAGKPPPAR